MHVHRLHSSVQFSSIGSINSSQRKSQWKANLKRWVLSRARNWLQLMNEERRWSGREFQTTGAAMKKLRNTTSNTVNWQRMLENNTAIQMGNEWLQMTSANTSTEQWNLPVVDWWSSCEWYSVISSGSVLTLIPSPPTPRYSVHSTWDVQSCLLVHIPAVQLSWYLFSSYI